MDNNKNAVEIDGRLVELSEARQRGMFAKQDDPREIFRAAAEKIQAYLLSQREHAAISNPITTGMKV